MTAAVPYLLGMLAVLVGERMLGGESPMRAAIDGVGALLLLMALGMLLRNHSAARGDQKAPHRSALVWALVGVASLGLYALTTDAALAKFAFDEEGEHRFEVAMTAAWVLVWLVGTVPFLMVDRAIAACTVVVTPGRVREAAAAGLATALGLALVLPANYLASAHNKRWDLGYFKTAEPGSSTRSLIDSAEAPIRAVLFFPSSSDVVQELRTYFDQIAGSNLSVEYVDHALDPELAKELKVRDNGSIALVRGEGDDQQVESIKIGVDFDSARKNLKQLDEKMQASLLKLTRGKRTAYVTVGHGEMYWKAGDPKDRKLDTFKKALGSMQYKVKELGLATGLAQEVPEDADLVAIIGPTEPFLDEEIKVLDAYRKRGGALLVALEPDGSDLSALLTPMGVGLDGTSPLVSDTNFLVMSYRPADRYNIGTNKFSTHESVTTISRNSKSMPVLTPRAGALAELPAAEGKVTVTVRTLPEVWADKDADLEFDANAEERKSWPLAAAITAPAAEGKESRAVVISDATWMSDLFLPAVQGNAVLLLDTVSWLVQDEAMAGTVNSEEDVKIQHTKEGQGWMFYGTSFLFPLMILSGGLAYVRSRKNQGAA